MKDNSVKLGLSKKEDIPVLFSYLYTFEKEIRSKAGVYNFNSVSFQAFCKENDIRCKNSLAKRELNKKNKSPNYFYFDCHTNIISKTDTAHHLSRHLRNSIAHALVIKEKNHYLFTDKNTAGNFSMTGRLRVDLFESFILELKKTAT